MSRHRPSESDVSKEAFAADDTLAGRPRLPHEQLRRQSLRIRAVAPMPDCAPVVPRSAWLPPACREKVCSQFSSTGSLGCLHGVLKKSNHIQLGVFLELQITARIVLRG